MPHCIQEGAPCPGVGTMTRTQAVPPQSWLPTGRAQEREKRSNLFVHCRFFLRSERPCSRGPRPRPSCHLSPVPTFPGWPLLPSMYSIDLSGFCKLTDADGRKNGAPLLVPSAQRASLCPISFLGRSDAGVMACRSSFLLLPPVLLVLLATGSRLLTADSVELQAVEGQTLTVRCSYTPETGPYVSKSWCRQTSVKSCTRVVTTYQPQTAVEKSRHTIWDDPEAGFLVVNITDLQEDDSGSYWCGNYNASENTIFILRNITLVVSPAPSSAPTWTTTTALVSSPEGTSGLSFNGSEHRGAEDHSGFQCVKMSQR
nr:trem-like transcript 4 protein isoform X2 [Cavia porcellus]